MSAETCSRCGREVVTIVMEVAESDLMMASCETCDTRRWRLAGTPMNLTGVLAKVGEHSGRRRA